jgi:hypothetical protein
MPRTIDTVFSVAAERPLRGATMARRRANGVAV